MERFIAENLMEQEVEMLCLGGGKFEGVVKSITLGVVTLEWDEKTTYVAGDKIVAAWPRSEKERLVPSLGFAPR
ncbi:MAG: MM0924 family protein [Ardenticatenaceae bacterium]